MAVNEIDWLKHQMSGKQYYVVVADFPDGERSYPFPKFEGAQKFSLSTAAHPSVSNVRIRPPKGGEIRVASTHKRVVEWSGTVKAQSYKATQTCPNSDCNDC